METGINKRVCRSAFFSSLDAANKAYSQNEIFSELRFDLSAIPIEDLPNLKLPDQLVFTCRKGNHSFEDRLLVYRTALEMKVDFIDIDFESDADLLKQIKQELAQSKTKLILSSHNFIETPSSIQLNKTCQKAFDLGADIAKIITTAKHASDADRIYLLYKQFNNLIAFAMGEFGAESRVQIIDLGAPFTYASFAKDQITAPGQMDLEATILLYNQINNRKS